MRTCNDSRIFSAISHVLLGIVLALPGRSSADDPATCVDPLAPIAYPSNTGRKGVTGTADAVRFLAMATFGANRRDIAHLEGMTTRQWIDEQFAMPVSCHLPALNQTQNNDSRENRIDSWWQQSIRAPDQLRQRVGFALSEIFVVSDVNSRISQNALAGYYDILLRNAFGNFRDILERVTLSPVMGRYLSMLGNQKPNPAEGIRADENYARELMQLFSIGLVQLDPGGAPLLQDGLVIPTYSQPDVEGLARVLTGWTWSDSFYFDDGDDWRSPMKAFRKYHDRNEKTILNNTRIPAGGKPEVDLALALDAVFHHPNVGPFIGRQLIQRLVTSNPSSAYVGRVSATFDDNGNGVRGDMAAVIRAILLDDEAVRGPAANPNFGKLREPLLVLTHLWRAFDGKAGDGKISYPYPESSVGQAPLSAPNVFNFFRPGFAPGGPIKSSGLVAPEFQMVHDASTTQLHNELFDLIQYHYRGNPWADLNDMLITISSLKNRAAKPLQLVAFLDLDLTGGQLPQDVHDDLVNYLRRVPMGSKREKGVQRSLDALYLVMSSPYYLIQR